MPRKRKCPVCGNWRWRDGDRSDEEGHHPDCGVSVRRSREVRAAVQRWREHRNPDRAKER